MDDYRRSSSERGVTVSTNGVWQDAGNDPDGDTFRRHGIDCVYFDVRDPRVTLPYLEHVRDEFGSAGLYLCSQGKGWPTPDKISGPAWADWAYGIVQKQIAPGTSGQFPRVILNCETHNVDWIVAMLKRWRKRSPRRATCWSMEGHQYPLFTQMADALRDLTVSVGPQCYSGDMSSRIESGTEVQEWGALVGAERVVPFLDAKALGAWWTGVAFSAGTLPR
jgi:hypothetical protein